MRCAVSIKMPVQSESHHIAAYPFLHTEREVFQLFMLNHSVFTVRETYIILNSNFSQLFCSRRCALFNAECETVNLQYKAFHKIFKEIVILQNYCSTRQCSKCEKYLCVLAPFNLYAEPLDDFEIESIPILYTDLLRLQTIHH